MTITRRFAACVAALLFALSGAHAQTTTGTIEGLVIDSVSLQPIVGATVTIEQTKIGAVSRDSGQFLLAKVPIGVPVLRVRAMGYKIFRVEVRLHAGEKQSVFAALTRAPERQEDVVITANKHVQAMQEVPISTSIIDGRDPSTRNAIQLDQVLRYVPGVNLNDNQVNIRGSSGYSRGLGSRVLLLIDGVPLLSGDSGELKMDAVPMMAIDRVEVVKGAGSALYGSSALGGVINVVTREPQDSVNMWMKVYGGGWPAPSQSAWRWYDGMRTQAGLGGGFSRAWDGLAVTAAGGVYTSDGYRQNDDFRRWDMYLKLGRNFSDRLSVWGTLTAANEDHGNWIFWRDLGHALLSSDSSTLYQRINSFKLQATGIAKYFITNDVISWTRAGFYRTNVDDNIDPLGPDAASKLVSHATSYSIEEQLTHTLADRTLLTYGAQSTGNVVKSNYYGDRSQWDAALYGQMEFRPLANLITTVGLRGTMSRTEDLPLETHVDPKIGLSYIVDDDFSLRASAGTGFRAPSVAERFVATRTGTLITMPNPGLVFERSASYEIGGLKTFMAGRVPVLVDAALFWSDYWNLIEPTFLCGLPARIQFENLTRARMQGIDGHVSAPLLGEHLSVSAAYTYMWGRSLTDDAPLKYRPRHLFTAGMNTSWGGLFAAADFRFASRVDSVDEGLNTCINPLTGYSVIPDFEQRVQTLVTDARVGVNLNTVAGLPLIITLNVYNLFQYYYTEIPANLAPIRNFLVQVEFMPPAF